MQFSWYGASGGEVTLAGGVVTRRNNDIYFIQAVKGSEQGYNANGDILVTWYKFTQDDKAYPDGPSFALKPIFTRNYTKPTLKLEEVLSKETSLRPSR